jgi:hypothetical protein
MNWLSILTTNAIIAYLRLIIKQRLHGSHMYMNGYQSQITPFSHY